MKRKSEGACDLITQLDLSILDWIQAHLRCGLLDTVMPIITLFGEGGIFWIVLALALLAIPRTRKVGLCMALALIADVLLCNVTIKPLVARPRPWTIRPEMEAVIRELTKLPSGYSFPSGHTAVSFSGAGTLLLLKTRGRVPASALAVLVGLSRLYLYVHYPTDVLCGALLGLLCGFLGARVGRKLWSGITQKKQRKQSNE